MTGWRKHCYEACRHQENIERMRARRQTHQGPEKGTRMTDTTTSAATGAGTDETAGLARRLLFLQEQEKAIAEEKQSIGRRLAKLQDTQKHDYAGVTVEVHAGRRTLDAKRFEQKFPPTEAPDYYVAKPKPLSKLQELVPGGVPDDCTKTGQPWATASMTEADHE